MTTRIPIQSQLDITSARNLLRKKMAGNKWLPPFRARSAISLMLMGELILLSGKPGTVAISVTTKEGIAGIELQCICVDDSQLVIDNRYKKLQQIADSLEATPKDGQLHIRTLLWLS